MLFERITIDPAVTTGKPCIRHLRFPVSRLLGLLAARESRESILSAYPYLEEADIDEALRYATRGRMVVPQDIEAAYREMAKDEERERGAQEWSEGVIGDLAGDQPGNPK